MAVAVAGLVAVACSSGGGGSDSEDTPSTSTSGSPSTAVIPATSGPSATSTDTPAVGVNVLDPVGIGETADFGDDVTAEVTGSEQIEAEAGPPGETAGPAYAVTIEVRNGSDAAVDLSQLAVSAVDGDGVPAIGNTSDPAEDLTGSLAPGARRSGVYVFRVPNGIESLLVSAQAGFSANTLQFEI